MYVYGKNVAKELIKKNKKIYKVIIYENFSDENLISNLQKLNIPIQTMTKKQIDEFAKGNHQGIILSIPDFKFADLDDLKPKNDEFPFIVILDHLEDPHNFGAIIRTCEAAGVDGIIIPKDRSVDINSTVMKTSVGALDNVPICMVTNLNNTIKELKKQGYWIVGTDMDGTDYTEIDYKCPICLVIGSEGNGMSRLVKESCDFIASIPMKGEINSLNASVATGIMIYEVLEKRK
ncbi:MAG: 23S rRNA (guanosine(2251)-2'-O)-methyltransferase RlmB [Bacilli bacterium]|nr:23S rRNA (guanosine(2251)-2'-O)-methyltransferase RlmB [Bacilli bacterium]